MYNIKKTLMLFCAALIAVTIVSTGPIAMAAEDISEEPGEITVRAEQTIWYYRNNNGVWEKRLWSITYQKWLTDWMPA